MQLVRQLNIYGQPTISVNSFVSASVTSVLIADANPLRTEIVLINNASKSMYINYGAHSDKKYIRLKSGEVKTITTVKGEIYAIWDSGVKDGVDLIETYYDI